MEFEQRRILQLIGSSHPTSKSLTQSTVSQLQNISLIRDTQFGHPLIRNPSPCICFPAGFSLKPRVPTHSPSGGGGRSPAQRFAGSYPAAVFMLMGQPLISIRLLNAMKARRGQEARRGKKGLIHSLLSLPPSQPHDPLTLIGRQKKPSFRKLFPPFVEERSRKGYVFANV